MKREIEGVQNPCRIEAGKTEGVLLWRKQVGLYRHIDNPERKIRVGMPGQADSTAIVEVEVTPDMVGRKLGMLVEFEFKAEKGRQSGKQADWQKAVENVSGKYYIIRSVEEFREVINKLKSGEF